MTNSEILNKVVIGNKDIQALFGCSHSKASEIIKAIKSNQDSFGGMLRGKVHIDDYNAFIKANRKKTKERGNENDTI